MSDELDFELNDLSEVEHDPFFDWLFEVGEVLHGENKDE